MSTSIGARFLFSVAANVARSALSLLTGLMVASALSPSGYGELMFLLASFIAIRALLDLGTSSAFFTFIARSRYDRAFYVQYCGWLALQFIVSLALVVAIFPQSVLDHIWLGQSRERVLLALIASFLQQQVWTTIAQIGEAARLTLRVQSLNLGIAVAHFVLVCVLAWLGKLSIEFVLAAIIAQITVAALFALRLLRSPIGIGSEVVHVDVRNAMRNYWCFCRPLILVAIIGFLYDFTDKWLLQKFGGAGQQGYYQVAAQLATVSLLATTSIMNIFWKEVAHAGAQQNRERMSMLYRRVSRGLVLLGAAIAGFLIPWAESIVELLLGAAYVSSWPIFTLMLLYPIHQSLGQVNATMFMASARTGSWMAVSIAGQLLSLPISYLLLAPRAGLWLPGLALGALGLALKMVFMNVLLTNVQSALLAKINGWKFTWLWQIAAIGGLLFLGYTARGISILVLPDAGIHAPQALACAFAIAGLLYAAGFALFVRSFPALLGCTRVEFREIAWRFLPAPIARFA